MRAFVSALWSREHDHLAWSRAPFGHAGSSSTPSRQIKILEREIKQLMVDSSARPGATPVVRRQRDWIDRCGSKQAGMVVVQDPASRDRLGAVRSAAIEAAIAVLTSHAPGNELTVVVEPSIIPAADYIQAGRRNRTQRPFGVADGAQHIWRPTARRVYGDFEMGGAAMGLPAAMRATPDDRFGDAEAAGLLDAMLSPAAHVLRHLRQVLAVIDDTQPSGTRPTSTIIPWIPTEMYPATGTRMAGGKTSLTEDALWADLCRSLLNDLRTVLIELCDATPRAETGAATLPPWLAMQLPDGELVEPRIIEQAAALDNGVALDAEWLPRIDPDNDSELIGVAVFPHPVLDTRQPDGARAHHRLFYNYAETRSFLLMPALSDGTMPLAGLQVGQTHHEDVAEISRAVRAVATPSGLMQNALDDVVMASARFYIPHWRHEIRMTADAIAQVLGAGGAAFPDERLAATLPRRGAR